VYHLHLAGYLAYLDDGFHMSSLCASTFGFLMSLELYTRLIFETACPRFCCRSTPFSSETVVIRAACCTFNDLVGAPSTNSLPDAVAAPLLAAQEVKLKRLPSLLRRPYIARFPSLVTYYLRTLFHPYTCRVESYTLAK